MTTQKTIAIVGATGETGSAIAASLAKTPHRLLLMSDDTLRLKELQKNVADLSKGNQDIIILDCAHEACWEADLIILAIPQERDHEIADKIRDVAVGKIVVASPDSGAGEELQRLLPYSSVVTACGTTAEVPFITPTVDGGRADLILAGYDSDALDEVAEIMQSAGYNTSVVVELNEHVE